MNADVRLRMECAFPERLLRRALESGAEFARVERIDDRTIIVETGSAGERVVSSLCRQYSIPMSVLSRRGGNAAGMYLRRRGTLLAGLIAAIAVCAWFLSHIWWIDVAFVGDVADRGNEAHLRALLAGLGVRTGMSARVDCAALSDRLQAAAASYSYIGVKRRGVQLRIEAAPEMEIPRLYDVDAARDLVARQDGIVVSANVRAGALCVKPGDAVRRGQLLIRGEELATADETRPIAALGEVVIRTWYTGEVELPLHAVQIRPTGRTSVSCALKLFGLRIPLSEGALFRSQRETAQALPIGGLYLPLEIERVTRIEVEEARIPLDSESVGTRASALAQADAAARLSLDGPDEYEISGIWIDPVESGSRDALRFRAVYEITTDAAVERQALSGND